MFFARFAYKQLMGYQTQHFQYCSLYIFDQWKEPAAGDTFWLKVQTSAKICPLPP